ncbi:MAG: tRNA dihydrouridine synthase DusB [Patescibacteria group bacterium]
MTNFTWNSFERPIIALSPMADLTDQPFCHICREVSGDSFVIFREMVSSVALVRKNEKTLKMCEIDELERPIVQQIFGSDASIMAEAANMLVEKFKPDAIDINMGCPAKKIVSNFDGASLMREPGKAAEIVTAVKSVVKIPVSVKTRLGWSRTDEILEFSKILEAAGADLLSIHGRTREQGYSGKADWEMIGRVKSRLKIPVLLNGDVTDGESAKKALEISNADGVLIGRGALGNPWIFKEIQDFLRPASHVSPLPSISERVEAVLRHAKLQVEHYGEHGIINLRKHLPFYFKKELKAEYPEIDFQELRSKLVRVSSFEELEGILLCHSRENGNPESEKNIPI